MAHACDVSQLGTTAVGGGECVDLVKSACGIGSRTPTWRAGDKVVGNHSIPPGTAIATFVDGLYPSHGHAAIYLGQDGQSIRVKQQYNRGVYPKVIHDTSIPIGGKGTHLAGDDANNYYVIR